jgi:hypothetical protein
MYTTVSPRVHYINCLFQFQPTIRVWTSGGAAVAEPPRLRVPVLSSCTASHSPLPSHLVAHRRGCLHWRAVRRWPVAVPEGRSRKLIRRRTLDRRRQRSSLSQPHNGDGHQGSIAQCPCRMLVYDCVNQSISLSRCCRNLGEESPPALAPVLVCSIVFFVQLYFFQFTCL